MRTEKHVYVALNRSLHTGAYFREKKSMISLKSMMRALTESRRMSNDRLSSLLELEHVITNLSTVEKSSNTKPQSQGNRKRMQMWHSEFRAD